MLRLVIFLLTLSAIAAVASCGDDETSATSSSSDAGNAGAGSIATGICPEVAPKSGESCLFPEGTTCAFGACGTPIAVCTGGLWRYGGNPPPRPPCPTEPPTADTTCPACFSAEDECIYGSDDCSAADASTNRARATCPSGTWALSFVPCAPPTDGGITDAGADVQGDADAEAD